MTEIATVRNKFQFQRAHALFFLASFRSRATLTSPTTILNAFQLIRHIWRAILRILEIRFFPIGREFDRWRKNGWLIYEVKRFFALDAVVCIRRLDTFKLLQIIGNSRKKYAITIILSIFRDFRS